MKCVCSIATLPSSSNGPAADRRLATWVPAGPLLDNLMQVRVTHSLAWDLGEPHCAAAPARFALEMNQGWFAAKGIKPGTRISGIEKAPAPR